MDVEQKVKAFKPAFRKIFAPLASGVSMTQQELITHIQVDASHRMHDYSFNEALIILGCMVRKKYLIRSELSQLQAIPCEVCSGNLEVELLDKESREIRDYGCTTLGCMNSLGVQCGWETGDPEVDDIWHYTLHTFGRSWIDESTRCIREPKWT